MYTGVVLFLPIFGPIASAYTALLAGQAVDLGDCDCVLCAIVYCFAYLFGPVAQLARAPHLH